MIALVSLAKIKDAVHALTADELSELTTFIRERDNATWDRQIDADCAVGGRLSALMEAVRSDLRAACANLRVPSCGMKESVGREGGNEVLHFFTKPKSIYIARLTARRLPFPAVLDKTSALSMARARSSNGRKDSSANLGFEASGSAGASPAVIGAPADQPSSSHRSVDLLGRVYEYFLGQFASAEGKKGGQFYTPQSVVRLLVEMLAPYKGRIYDPCCGSGGMFVQSEKFVEAHGGKIGDISIYGQESNPTTRRLAVMNLALRGITISKPLRD